MTCFSPIQNQNFGHLIVIKKIGGLWKESMHLYF